MSKYPVTVFDMDGTLIDSVPGIVNGVKYTLDRLKMEPPEDFDIRPCLGPPLAWTFETHLRVPPDKVEEAIAVYREYYGKTGAFEAEIYPGVKALLEDLNQAGATVCLATTKYSMMAEMMLKHFGLWKLIRHAAMATADQVKSTKKEMLQDLLKRCGQSPEKAVMIGDTLYDAEGATSAGLDFIGVLYGYGLREEMERAGGRKFVADTRMLRKALLN